MRKFSLISASNKEAGFTLIEILIAISLLAFISIGVITIVQNASNTMERTTEINKNNLQIETALSRFEWDFSQIYSPTYFSQIMDLKSKTAMPGEELNESGDPNTPVAAISPELSEYYQRLISRFEGSEHFWAITNDGLPVPAFYSPDKTIFEFFTSSNRRKLENSKQSHFAWVRYALGPAIERDTNSEKEPNANIPPSLKTLVRYFSADDPYGKTRLDPNNNNNIKGAVLLENVESLEFQFWDMKRKKWENNLKAIENGDHIIRGVKLLITWYDSAGFKRSVSRVYRNFWPMVIPQDPQAPAKTSKPKPDEINPDEDDNEDAS